MPPAHSVRTCPRGFLCDECKAQAKIAVVLGVASDRPVPVSGDHRLQHVAPLVGAVHIAWTQGTPFNVAELVEHQQRMIRNSLFLSGDSLGRV